MEKGILLKFNYKNYFFKFYNLLLIFLKKDIYMKIN